jgi:RNA polymerase sigma-70 factor, ECF subfamily
VDVSEGNEWSFRARSMRTGRSPQRSDNERESEALIVRIAGGDDHALTVLYDSTNRIVYGLALRVLGEPSCAEDTTMEVYLQVWRTAESYDPQRGTVLSWLATLARSRAIDCLRNRKARRAELEENVDEVANLRDPRPSPELASVEDGRVADSPESHGRAVS